MYMLIDLYLKATQTHDKAVSVASEFLQYTAFLDLAILNSQMEYEQSNGIWFDQQPPLPNRARSMVYHVATRVASWGGMGVGLSLGTGNGLAIAGLSAFVALLEQQIAREHSLFFSDAQLKPRFQPRDQVDSLAHVVADTPLPNV